MHTYIPSQVNQCLAVLRQSWASRAGRVGVVSSQNAKHGQSINLATKERVKLNLSSFYIEGCQPGPLRHGVYVPKAKTSLWHIRPADPGK
jgi:hypothetical protein